ncbi:ATP-binding cassette domain-containing protein [Streptomyces sp. NPDC058770]|uniref:ATP-binding cassette domain-containing protein n=1 Tax=Streptomyces sp. NPDC058770 TaxID=3346631 RepID=UPI0036AD459A
MLTPERPGTVRALNGSVARLAAGVGCAALAAGAGTALLVAVVEFVRAPATRWVWWGALALTAAGALNSLSSWLAHGAEAEFEHRLRRALAVHVSRLPTPALARLGTTGLRARLDGDVTALHHAVAHLPGEIATMLIAPFAALVLLTGYAGPLGLVAVVPAALAAVFHLVVIPRRSRRFAADRGRVVARIVAAVDDMVRGAVITRVHGDESGASARYTAATREFAHGFRDWVGRVATPAAVATALLQPSATLAVAFCVGHRMPVWQLTAVCVFGLAALAPVLRLGHGLDHLGAARDAAGRIDALLAEPVLHPGPAEQPPASGTDSPPPPPTGPPVTSITTGTSVTPVDGDAASAPAPVLDAVTVTVDGRPVLGPLDLAVVPNAVTAVTGPSGSGKTTLLRLLSRGTDPDDGTISLGGTPYRDLPLASMARRVATVPQSPGVLPRSIRENLLLARPHATDEELRAALAAAALPVPLDAPAAPLSGGERQRLALARALLTGAPVLVLDEPTSALDPDTARTVMNTLLSLPARTVVLATHDHGLAARAHHRIVLEHGEVIA